MKMNSTLPLLVKYVNQFLQDHDLSKFYDRVVERYSIGTLCRLLQSEDARLRRSAALAIGIVGSPEGIDRLVQALRDSDDVVREWAEKSLWMVWFRTAAPDQNLQLQQVALLIAQDKPAIAVDQATELIGAAPKFAEAYNQRAIAYWRLGMYDEAVRDCRRVIELNPLHFGAAAGMGQCLLQRGDQSGAIACFEKALEINPNLADVSELLSRLRGNSTQN
jgi:tetratricopeptide (TPR) repeat protein